MEDNKKDIPNRLGGLYDNEKGKHQAGSVWDKECCDPTLDTMQGGRREPLILEDFYSNRELRVYDDCPTQRADRQGLKVIEAMPNERFFKQAIETVKENDCKYGDTINAYNKTVNDTELSPTLTTRPEGFKTAILPIDRSLRIRKLTPKECWRLMGFSDECFDRAAEVNSNSQLYKQAGNSIVVDVLENLFVNLFVENHMDTYIPLGQDGVDGQMSIFDL